jgi:hypothetical protein
MAVVVYLFLPKILPGVAKKLAIPKNTADYSNSADITDLRMLVARCCSGRRAACGPFRTIFVAAPNAFGAASTGALLLELSR